MLQVRDTYSMYALTIRRIVRTRPCTNAAVRKSVYGTSSKFHRSYFRPVLLPFCGEDAVHGNRVDLQRNAVCMFLKATKRSRGFSPIHSLWDVGAMGLDRYLVLKKNLQSKSQSFLFSKENVCRCASTKQKKRCYRSYRNTRSTRVIARGLRLTQKKLFSDTANYENSFSLPVRSTSRVQLTVYIKCIKDQVVIIHFCLRNKGIRLS